MTDDELKAIRVVYDRGYTTTAANDIPKLLDEIVRLRAENARLREACTLALSLMEQKHEMSVPLFTKSITVDFNPDDIAVLRAALEKKL